MPKPQARACFGLRNHFPDISQRRDTDRRESNRHTPHLFLRRITGPRCFCTSRSGLDQGSPGEPRDSAQQRPTHVWGGRVRLRPNGASDVPNDAGFARLAFCRSAAPQPSLRRFPIPARGSFGSISYGADLLSQFQQHYNHPLRVLWLRSCRIRQCWDLAMVPSSAVPVMDSKSTVQK